MNPKQTVAPKLEPVSLQEMKDHLRITHADDMGLIEGQVMAARLFVEGWLGRQMIQATYELARDCFPGQRLQHLPDDRSGYRRSYSKIDLPWPPLVSVSGITYIDNDGATQTLDTSIYTVDTYREPGAVHLAWGKSWPSVRIQPNAVKVTYLAGHADAESVPAMDKHLIKLVAGDLYEHRETIITGTIQARIDGLLSMFWHRKIPQVGAA